MLLIILFLLLLFMLLVIFWQGSLLLASIIGSPIVYANKPAVRECLKLAGLKKGELLVDLGCGNAGVLILAAKEFGARGLGVDRSLFSFLKSKWNVWQSGESDKIRIVFGPFQKIEKELQGADVVYMYLLNTALAKIENWFFSSISEKTRAVSLAFNFPNAKPVAQSQAMNLGIMTKIRLYRRDR